MRWILCAVVWLLSAAVALAIAAETKIGPTVIQISPRHGVHTGDVLAVMGAIAFGSMSSLAIWRLGNRGQTSSATAARRDRAGADLDRLA